MYIKLYNKPPLTDHSLRDPVEFKKKVLFN